MSTDRTTKKQAEKDALEWSRAKLAYGEGAGVRRRLINETVDYKIARIPGYGEAWDSAVEKQDVAALAKNAKRDGRRKAANETITRNTKAVISGKYENVNTGILVVGAIAVVLHKTGYDTKVIEGTKRHYNDLRRRFRKTPPAPKPTGKKTDDVIHNITFMDA